jgi:hypothetical protein
MPKRKAAPTEYRGRRRVRGFGSNPIHAVNPEKIDRALCGQQVRIGSKSTAGVIEPATDLQFIENPCARCKELRNARVELLLRSVTARALPPMASR